MDWKEITLEAYTDGACSSNGAKNAIGGWAFILFFNTEDSPFVIQQDGWSPSTTNQQMELKAAVEALKAGQKIMDNQGLKELEVKRINLYTDSAYLANCYKDKWWIKWVEDGWVRSDKQKVKNRELWEQLIPHFKNESVRIIKVAGHSGNPYNEIVDELARKAVLRGKQEQKEQN